MYTAFNLHLGFNDASLPQENILILDRGIDGNFLLHHLATHYLKNNGKVCLLGFAQTLSHYVNACHKLGVNLEKAIEKNHYIFIDALKYIFDSFLSKDSPPNIFSGIAINGFSLRPLLDTIIGLNTSEGEPMIVLIDDICSLINIGVSVQVIADFIHYCNVLTSQRKLSFAFVAHNEEEDPNYTLLHYWLKHYTTLEIQVQALKTGYSRELSGEIHIHRQRSIEDSVITKQLHFKLLDKDVKFFHPGTSSAVL